jgi:hypothetical protein
MKELLSGLFRRNKRFNSKDYWESRYALGGNSGEGSYGRLSEFKAEILNDFVSKCNIQTVIEFGCGDGNQLTLASYPKYIGLDISKTVIKKCIEKFCRDRTKSFFLYDQDCFADNGKIFTADLALSLDVLYHLIEKPVYEIYLLNLFDSAVRYVVIYSPDRDAEVATHESHRRFTKDVERLISGWELFDVIENRYQPSAEVMEEVSQANFYFYKRK